MSTPKTGVWGLMIPHNLHQVWIGPDRPPLEWMQTWKDQHPQWGYRLWRDADIVALENAPLYRRLMKLGLYAGACDVARVEILYRYGGVYVDADSECLRPLDGASFLEAGFFVMAWRGDEYPRLLNQFMGSKAGHPILKETMRLLSQLPTDGERIDYRPLIQKTGGCVLLRAVDVSGSADVAELPTITFQEFDRSGRRQNPNAYARHHWVTSKKQSRRQ